MGSELEKLLREKKNEILEKWENSILGQFEKDSFIIFKKQHDQIANPIGHKVRTGLAELYDVLIDPSDREVLTPDLEQLIKLRAVQNVAASDAVSFVYKLKELVRKEILKKRVAELYKDWLAFDARVDAAALAIFDMFMANRERVFRVRLDEFKKGRDLLTDHAVCPSALMRQNREKKNAEAQSGQQSDKEESAG